MTEGRGGYRRPTNPAPVSGPGELSQRTDGGPPMPPMPQAPEAQQQPTPEQMGIPQMPDAPKVDPVLAAASKLQILEAMYTRNPSRKMRSILEQAYFFGVDE